MTTFEHDFDVVGLKFRMKVDDRNKLAALAKSKLLKVALEREPENQYDDNAICVMAKFPTHKPHIGYIRKESAALLAPLMDDGKLVFRQAVILTLSDGPNGPNSEVSIHASFTDKR